MVTPTGILNQPPLISKRQQRRDAYVTGLTALINSEFDVYSVVSVTKPSTLVEGLSSELIVWERDFHHATSRTKTIFRDSEIPKEKAENAGYFVALTFEGKTIAIIILKQMVTNAQLNKIGIGLSLLAKNLTDKIEQRTKESIPASPELVEA